MPAHLVLDFDDTLLCDSLTNTFFERFCEGPWRERLAEYQRGQLTVEQYNAEALKLVQAEDAEIRAWAQETAVPRDGLAGLAGACAKLGVHCSVVSNSFDILIDPVLQKHGFRVPRHCGVARHRYVWQVSYTDTAGYPVRGGFKEVWVQAFRRAGDTIIYCGDGASDFVAAEAAHCVFARDSLLEHRRSNQPAVPAV
jgi:HAD superfamily phosphoserine phosphatase-like hydrolase